MTPALEAITKATQTAELLCQDLREVFRNGDPLLSEVAATELEQATAMQRRLDRFREAVERQEAAR